MKRRGEKKIGFKEAVDTAEDLELRQGLKAIKKAEGKDRIRQHKGTKLVGSVEIDGDCLKRYPTSARWDYVVGVARKSGDAAIFVEVHSAETSGISDIEKKLTWLFDVFLRRDAQAPLRSLPREVLWVASGRVNIPSTTPQARYLATTLRKKYQLKGPTTLLVIS